VTTSYIDPTFRAQVSKEAGRFIGLGAAFLIIGAAAVVFPAVSTLAATYFVGGALVLFGVVTLSGAFALRGVGVLRAAGPFCGALFLGLLSVAAGAFIFARPHIGELAITLSLGALFIVQGAFELALTFALRGGSGRRWMLLSAAASFLLAIVILAGWPGTSVVALGTIMGVNFVSSGLAYLMVGAAVKREARAWAA
jgi:uncharacterized membrane protein HdeD (DUF308 family)